MPEKTGQSCLPRLQTCLHLCIAHFCLPQKQKYIYILNINLCMEANSQCQRRRGKGGCQCPICLHRPVTVNPVPRDYPPTPYPTANRSLANYDVKLGARYDTAPMLTIYSLRLNKYGRSRRERPAPTFLLTPFIFCRHQYEPLVINSRGRRVKETWPWEYYAAGTRP